MSLYSPSDFKRQAKVETKGDAPEGDYRTPWRRDYGRIVHSHAFRRLQGKTQLFPGLESDFFRNRLSHSLEVAQIAKSIAIRINSIFKHFTRKINAIEPEIVEIAGLAHDLGHPPFGHNGEQALNRLMKNDGGFESNAQTLRILTKIEKRQKDPNSSRYGVRLSDGEDKRYGHNLTYRTLASILKYDVCIPQKVKKLTKGYYQSERVLVKEIKENVTGVKNFMSSFKTIECQIMDIADDIAYATYDLEDALKNKFLSPFDLLNMEENIAVEVRKRVNRNLARRYRTSTIINVANKIFGDIFSNIIPVASKSNLKDSDQTIAFSKEIINTANLLMEDGYSRTSFTSRLVGKFIRSIQVDEINSKIPALTKISLNDDIRLIVEVLKQFSYVSVINSPILRVSAYRGKEIIEQIFEALRGWKRGFELLPPDYRTLYQQIHKDHRKRIICDFIAGMTDRYALEFYGRLVSENPQTIFKPM